ncbi:hypothetical protein EYC80_009003 [Monilinia laxa]|uniref:Uncharacterized protein n=1 Tax=Monilinia laxa TaxID=61186 RepID=A0A5N6K233_MONLA|nr:hypothetical protein EYC80_009003 [Monilinia laxa]
MVRKNPKQVEAKEQSRTREDSRLKTQDSRLKTQDSRLKTQDSKRIFAYMCVAESLGGASIILLRCNDEWYLLALPFSCLTMKMKISPSQASNLIIGSSAWLNKTHSTTDMNYNPQPPRDRLVTTAQYSRLFGFWLLASTETTCRTDAVQLVLQAGGYSRYLGSSSPN